MIGTEMPWTRGQSLRRPVLRYHRKLRLQTRTECRSIPDVAEPIGTWGCHRYAGKRQKLSRGGVRRAANTDEPRARGDTCRDYLSSFHD